MENIRPKNAYCTDLKGNKIQVLYQYDKNIKIIVRNSNRFDMAAFTVNTKNGMTVRYVIPSSYGGDFELVVPNEILEIGEQINIYLRNNDADSAETVGSILIPVIRKACPINY